MKVLRLPARVGLTYMCAMSVAVLLGACGPRPESPDRTGEAQGGGGDNGEACRSVDLPTFGMQTGDVVSVNIAPDYSTGSVAHFNLDDRETVEGDLLTTTGDAVVRDVNGLPVILQRGPTSSLIKLDNDLDIVEQVDLGACNAYDVELLDDCRALVSCYDQSRAKLVNWQTHAVSDGPDFSAFADGDGIPEMDQILRMGEVLVVSLQRLDRDAMYAPDNPSLLALLNAQSLELVDTEPATAELDGIQLPCRNPFTEMHVGPAGRAVVGCAGGPAADSGPESMVVAVDIDTSTTEVLANETELGGKLSELVYGHDGASYALVASPDLLNTTSMNVLRVDASDVTTVHTQSGYNLSGLAADTDGRILIGDRSTNDAGIWIRAPNGTVFEGPVAPEPANPEETPLPPSDIVVF